MNFLERAQPLINSPPASIPHHARAPPQNQHSAFTRPDLDFIALTDAVQDSLRPSQAKMKDKNHNSGVDNPSRGGKVLKIPGKIRRLESESMMEQDKESKLQEKNWIDRFTRLERALHLLDNRTAGGLYQCEARRVINNYNLIHHLNLRPQKIQEALDQFQSNGKVIVEPILQYLKEL
ncbi:uncharacterized protein C1orf87 [Callorhinchus milii]|nr:uncharacterized protein C1orf87 [Callorhinchus milii]